MNKLILVLVAGLALALPHAAQAQPKEDAKIVAKTADDLPRHKYQIEGKPSEFILTDKPFAEFVAKVKADVESDLAKYQIDDPTTLQTYYGVLLSAAMYEGHDAEALALVEKIRDKEAKDSKKLTTGLVIQSIIAAKKAAGTDAQKFNAAFKHELNARTKDLPWDKVRETITQGKGRAEILSKDLMLGGLKGQLDPVVEQSKGELSNELAWALVGARFAMDKVLPVNPMVVEVYSDLIKSHDTVKVDTWSGHLVTLAPTEKATPVVVAIWDSGVDVSIFSDRLWTNPNEVANGKDDDKNGFVDDLHGIAYDLKSDPTPDLLHPLGDLKSDKDLVTSYMKGMLDTNANIDSPEATALKTYMRSLKGDHVTSFIEDLTLFGNYSHGTHVAGIASDGNPFVRLMPVRITFDFHAIPTVTPSVEQAEKEAKAAHDCIAYMRKAGVRVCNMSWGGSRKDIEKALETKGVGKTPEDRAALSRQLFKIQHDALETAMKSAPEILFIAAAGNSDNDNQFDEMLPSGLNLPNMITVGAVDQGGKPTDFTSFGKNVALYANGFEVESYIPGGKRMKFSGTSMAAPNTTNLAAKLIAINPKLTTAQVIELMTKGAEPMAGKDGRAVINPKKSIEMARKP